MSFAPAGAFSAPFFTRGSLRSPLAIFFRASGAGRAFLPVILSFETASSAPTSYHPKQMSNQLGLSLLQPDPNVCIGFIDGDGCRI
jgi:hypothetical protein